MMEPLLPGRTCVDVKRSKKIQELLQKLPFLFVRLRYFMQVLRAVAQDLSAHL